MDATSSTRPVPDYVSAVSKGVKGLKFGLPEEYMNCSMEAGVRTAVEAGIQRLKEAGAEVVSVDLPHTEYVIPTYYILASAEASSNLARYDGVRYGHRSSGEGSLEEMYQDTRTEGFGTEVQRRIMLGTFSLSSGYVDEFYVKAQRVRTLIIEDFKRAFEQVDVLVSPTVPVVAWEHGAMSEDPLAMYQMDVLTTACNLAGLPGISVPCGFSEGLPVGLQLMAAPFQEEKLFAAAGAHEERFEQRSRRPDLRAREWMSED
jgi:aspartyl-tRNA(Asn)/glutamyl-tRNA(Gln) amidotransferase subunit A